MCPPRETWDRVAPLLPRAGITRVADLTWMDDIGIPIYQAVRPQSRSLSVSQGKGISPIHSKVSAVMESFEVFHAERPRHAPVHASTDELGTLLPYSPHHLNLRRPSLFHRAMRLQWYPARILFDGTETLVPADVVNMDTRVDGTPVPVVFHRDSNGLASGNTLTEACVHALYEVIERASHHFARGRAERPVATHTVVGAARELIGLFDNAGALIRVSDVSLSGGPACFQVRVWSPSFPVVCWGAGCHSDPDVALCRALTEAAQSRVTAISGMREDIEQSVWELLAEYGREEPTEWRDAAGSDFGAIPPAWLAPTLGEDLQHLIDFGRRIARNHPIFVDLTDPDFEIPVVKVIVPGMPVYMP